MNNYQIFSDFSDTIAKPLSGEKFPPFELELGKLAGVDISAQYSHFLSVRSNETIPYEDRMQIWLKPLTNLLTLKHIEQLVSTFIYNENYSKVTELLKSKLYTNSLEITIVSGTLWQVINCFLTSAEVSQFTNKCNISFEVGAAKLGFDMEGKFNGELTVTNKLAYSKNSSFPEKYLIIGDNAMESYGFGEKLLNAQEFNSKTISERIEKYLNDN
jgi:hypothetical protein